MKNELKKITDNIIFFCNQDAMTLNELIDKITSYVEETYYMGMDDAAKIAEFIELWSDERKQYVHHTSIKKAIINQIILDKLN